MKQDDCKNRPTMVANEIRSLMKLIYKQILDGDVKIRDPFKYSVNDGCLLTKAQKDLHV